MIISFIFNGIFGVITELLMVLPEMAFDIPPGAVQNINDFILGVKYVLPVDNLLMILYASMSMTAFRVVMSIIIRVKSFIPTMGA